MRLLMNVLLFGLLTILCNLAAATEEEESKAAIAYRQSLYRSILWNFLPMSEMVRGKRGYDAEEIKKRSLAVAYLASLLNEAFPVGSGASSGTTDALEEVWLNPADFDVQMKDFQRESNMLRKIAQQADQNLFTEQFKKLGATCKSCHQKYKAQ